MNLSKLSKMPITFISFENLHIISRWNTNKSIAAPKELLASVMRRLELKGEKFELFESATEQKIEAFSEVLLSVDDCLQITDTTKTALKDKTKLHEFIKHCCQVRKYSFCVQKCGSPEYTLCKPVRIDPELFKSVHFLPDPLIGEDNHYKSFADLYGSTTTERDCPSFSQPKAKKRSHSHLASSMC